jgi:sugar-specific transcriptional regulator TrmB
VPTAEAIGTVEQTYNSRVDELQQQLESVAEQTEYHTEQVNEVWALSGQQAITSRSRRLIQEAANELIFVVGGGEVEAEILSDLQSSQIDRRVLIGVPTEARKEKLQSRLPGVTVFLSNYEWLTADTTSEDSAAINRMLLADRSSFLIGSSTVDTDSTDEQAVFGRGFNNGLVVIARWLLLARLAPGESD